MSDDTVRSALRSDAPLVAIEAPAGCGKTHQGADYAREIARANASRVLILTHTHAACSVFATRTAGSGRHVEIRTLDGVVAQIATAYHAGLGLPADPAVWARRNANGYAHVAQRVALLLERHPMIAAALARRYPMIICDEHQDCSGDQHSLSMALLAQGSRVRIFADPMQRIFREKSLAGSQPAWDWNGLTGRAQHHEQLDTPHRWAAGCPALGQWTLQARATLMAGGSIDLREDLPPSVTVVFAENQSQRNLDYQLGPNDRRPVDTFVREQTSLLVLTHHNDTAQSLRSFFNRRLPLWEGHTRDALDALVDNVRTQSGNAPALAAAVVAFMDDVGKGFSPSAFGDRLEKEVSEGCTKASRGKPALIQEMARLLLVEPDHRGIAKMLRRLAELKAAGGDFAGIEFDRHKEFWDAVQLGNFTNVDEGLTELTNRRTYARPRPPDKAISTVHKAKGLECGSVVLMPCDARTFPDKPEMRCLLYVALSRATQRLMLVLSRNNPSPLFRI